MRVRNQAESRDAVVSSKCGNGLRRTISRRVVGWIFLVPSAYKMETSEADSDKAATFSGQHGTLTIGDFELLQEQENARWREMPVQERVDQFVALMRIWKADAPGLARTISITTIS